MNYTNYENTANYSRDWSIVYKPDLHFERDPITLMFLWIRIQNTNEYKFVCKQTEYCNYCFFDRKLL